MRQLPAEYSLESYQGLMNVPFGLWWSNDMPILHVETCPSELEPDEKSEYDLTRVASRADLVLVTRCGQAELLSLRRLYDTMFPGMFDSWETFVECHNLVTEHYGVLAIDLLRCHIYWWKPQPAQPIPSPAPPSLLRSALSGAIKSIRMPSKL